MNHFATQKPQRETNDNEFLEKLSQFLNRYHKHPDQYEDPILWEWILRVRNSYKKQCLNSALKSRLNAIGFKWTIKEAKWFDNAKQVKLLLTEHELVPSISRHMKLFYWLKDANDRLRNKVLSHDEETAITEINELVNSVRALGANPLNCYKTARNMRWIEKWKQLKKFRKVHATHWPRLDAVDEAERKLAMWCQDLRARYKKESLEKEWINKLNKIGFNFKGGHPQTCVPMPVNTNGLSKTA